MSDEGKRFETDFAGGTVAQFGTFYPRHYVVGVVRDPAQAASAEEALVATGFAAGDVVSYSGAQVLDHHALLEDQRRQQHRGLLERLGELFPADEKEAMNEYLDAARSGATIVTVYAPEKDRQKRAGAVLRDHGGVALRYYGDRTYTDL